jgi:hypothetical protein
MRVRWRRERASCGNATWLVGIEPARVSVLAPPGVPISRFEELEAELLHGAPGWRWAVWDRRASDHWPVIDSEAPDAMREIDTVDVLRLLHEELHEHVWSCLWSQLQVARGFGHPELGRVAAEDLARAGAISVTWLTDELARGFPERAYLLDLPVASGDAGVSAEAPDDPAELVGALPVDLDPPLPLRCGAPLRALVLHWVSWRLRTHRRSRWVARKLISSAHPDEDLILCQSCRTLAPAELTDVSWSGERWVGAEPGAGEMLLERQGLG